MHVQHYYAGSLGKSYEKQKQELEEGPLALLPQKRKEKMAGDAAVIDYYGGSFGKSYEKQKQELEEGPLALLPQKRKEKMAGDAAVIDYYAGILGKSYEKQKQELEEGPLALLPQKEKEKLMTGFLNVSTFSDKSSIKGRVAKTLARVDISEAKKLDIVVQVKGLGLTTLGAKIQLASATSEGEIRAATGRIASLAAGAASRPANKLLDKMDGLWKEVIDIAPEITCLDQNSKEPWHLKRWATHEKWNPPKCRQWAEKLKTKEVQARIDHYVLSPAPQAHHARLRILLPQLTAAMKAYRTAKNLKTNSNPKPRRYR
jgi:uncharacterized protein YunC (DUF1805 family)